VIEGVPRPRAVTEEEPDEEPDLATFGKQMSRTIQAKVLRELERSMNDEPG
jgi:hypothetical protein